MPVFEEEGERWGLALVGYGTQAAFFDYDRDGDLDMFMLQHSVHNNGTFGTARDLRFKPHPTAGDKLLRNDGDRFTDVTAASGIYSSVIGYGLGISTGDVNVDGWPDIYIGNDFHEDDYLYLNNGNGTFREVLNDVMGHTSRFSMGTDIADFNNDGLPDIISLDMLPEDPLILKSAASEDPMDIFEFKLSYGYNHQYARNNLQLNAGVRRQADGRHEVAFSEIACYAGIPATDWSWSALFCDLDLDGFKDIFISNGILRRSNDLDYIKYIEADSIQFRLKEQSIDERDLELSKRMPTVKLANYAYRNTHDLHFTNLAQAWGLDQPSYSNGTVYTDLDGDGDLDLVVNNLEDPAFIYKNLTLDAQKPVDSGKHYLKLAFEGSGKNRHGIGARVFFDTPYGRQMQENFTTRGFQSAVEPVMVIGLGGLGVIDSIHVIWPTGEFQVLRQVKADQTLKLRQTDASGSFDFTRLLPVPAALPPLVDISEKVSVDYSHRENKFIEFNRERLIPNMNSTEGPKLAVGDVNGDGRADFFVGGAKWQAGKLFVQNKSGGFAASPQPALEQDSVCEDAGAVFFDADGDKDLDLVVVSGGNEFREGEPALQPRFYRNDGQGRLSRAPEALSGLSFNGSCAVAADFDGDGDTDLFLGGHTVPWSYGLLPRSYLLENDGNGVFRDVTAARAAGLEYPGLVKDAVWADLNGDRKPDLVLAGEWMPVSVFFNRDGRLEPGETQLEPYLGWWNCVEAADLDGDGDLDLLAGNYGLNSKLSASTEHPLRMYVNDFDLNKTQDQLLTYYYGGEERLFATKDELQAQVPSIKKKVLKYRDFARSSLQDLFDPNLLRQSRRLETTTLASAWFENQGDGRFVRHELPQAAQFSPIQAFLVRDFNRDGRVDILAAGNYFEANPELGRYDASYGTLMLGLGQGNFRSLTAAESGLWLKGQCRDLQEIETSAGPLILVARNKERLAFLRLGPGSPGD